MTNIRIFIAFLLMAILQTSTVCLDIEQEEQIREFLEAFLQCSGTPGLSLGVVKDGVTELATGYGRCNLIF